MPGANYMGGKRNAAKFRSRDTAARAHRLHFGKQKQKVGIGLGMFSSGLRNGSGCMNVAGAQSPFNHSGVEALRSSMNMSGRPGVLDIQLKAAHEDSWKCRNLNREGEEDCFRAASSPSQRLGESISVSSLTVAAANAKSKPPPAKRSSILEKLDMIDPICYQAKIKRILSIPDFAGLNSLHPRSSGTQEDAHRDSDNVDADPITEETRARRFTNSSETSSSLHVPPSSGRSGRAPSGMDSGPGPASGRLSSPSPSRKRKRIEKENANNIRNFEPPTKRFMAKADHDLRESNPVISDTPKHTEMKSSSFPFASSPLKPKSTNHKHLTKHNFNYADLDSDTHDSKLGIPLRMPNTEPSPIPDRIRYSFSPSIHSTLNTRYRKNGTNSTQSIWNRNTNSRRTPSSPILSPSTSAFGDYDAYVPMKTDGFETPEKSGYKIWKDEQNILVLDTDADADTPRRDGFFQPDHDTYSSSSFHGSCQSGDEDIFLRGRETDNGVPFSHLLTPDSSDRYRGLTQKGHENITAEAKKKDISQDFLPSVDNDEIPNPIIFDEDPYIMAVRALGLGFPTPSHTSPTSTQSRTTKEIRVARDRVWDDPYPFGHINVDSTMGVGYVPITEKTRVLKESDVGDSEEPVDAGWNQGNDEGDSKSELDEEGLSSPGGSPGSVYEDRTSKDALLDGEDDIRPLLISQAYDKDSMAQDRSYIPFSPRRKSPCCTIPPSSPSLPLVNYSLSLPPEHDGDSIPSSYSNVSSTIKSSYTSQETCVDIYEVPDGSPRAQDAGRVGQDIASDGTLSDSERHHDAPHSINGIATSSFATRTDGRQYSHSLLTQRRLTGSSPHLIDSSGTQRNFENLPAAFPPASCDPDLSSEITTILDCLRSLDDPVLKENADSNTLGVPLTTSSESRTGVALSEAASNDVPRVPTGILSLRASEASPIRTENPSPSSQSKWYNSPTSHRTLFLGPSLFDDVELCDEY